jgi:hypothetical protein
MPIKAANKHMVQMIAFLNRARYASPRAKVPWFQSVPRAEPRRWARFDSSW